VTTCGSLSKSASACSSVLRIPATRRRPRTFHWPRSLAFLLVAFLLCAHVASAEQLKLSFAEVAQTADLIFIGTVSEQSSRVNDKRTMIFTDVVFRAIQIVHATARSTQKSSATIRLTYAGGRVGNRGVDVSDTPRFTEGRRYLIFMADDGRTYSSPIIGGSQGLFEVVRDAASGQEYVLTAGKKAIIGVGDKGLVASEHRVSAIENGSLVAEVNQDAASARINAEPAIPADSDSSYSPRVAPDEKNARPLTLTEFVDYIKNVALKTQLKERRIKRDGVGFFYRNNNGKVEAERIQTSAPPVRILAFGPDGDNLPQLNTEVPRASTTPFAGKPSSPSVVDGGAVGACGYHNLDLVMEQVPAAWWEWQVVNDNMYVWNQEMDIFRYIDDDGSWGDNSTNEFAGYPSDADINAQYGFGWSPGDLAVTITSYSGDQCAVIDQSDVCWNPAYSWTNDFSISLDGDPLLLRPINQHETGHAWGAQRGPYVETYDYDIATVMQAYYSDIIEDGWGIHADDAYLIRRQYQDQRAINGAIRDVGVESYYASNGLNNSTTDANTYTPGQSITLNNILVENMTYGAVSELRIRFFLSTNNVISTSDRQMGSYWYWTSFCGECYNVGNYTTSIPTNVPPGTYYVGAIVTIDGFNNDDLTWNNRTYLYKKITVTCNNTYSLSPGSDYFEKGGGSGHFNVYTRGSACGWSAYSDAGWLTITSGSSGTGNGTVYYSATANTGVGSRFATIHVANLSYSVLQAPGCLTTSANSISIGQTISGTLSSSDCLSPLRTRPGGYKPYADRYKFYAVAGQRLAIALSSSAFDTYLYLIGPNGSVIASDDDGGGGTNSRIPAGSGNYTAPSNGTYTIEVTSYSENRVGGYSLSLIGTVIKFTISGHVALGSTSLAGVTMTLTGDRRFTPRTTNTLSNGTYSFANVPAGGTYTVTPSKTNYNFTPGSRTYTTLNGNRTTADFAATLKTYSISGKVVRAGTTVGLDAVNVVITASGFTTRTYTTTSTGIYTFTALPAGKSYTVKPTKARYTFSPTARSFPNLSANQPAGSTTNFAGTPQ
jgi:hypothetical protein